MKNAKIKVYEKVYEDGDKETRVKEIAYQKWINAGMPKGRDLDFWLEAEKEFYGKRKKKKVLKE